MFKCNFLLLKCCLNLLNNITVTKFKTERSIHSHKSYI